MENGESGEVSKKKKSFLMEYNGKKERHLKIFWNFM